MKVMPRARVVALVPDLMDRSRVAAAAARCGRPLVVVATAGELAAASDEAGATYLVDLARPGALEALAGLPGERTVGFAGHVERELVSRARSVSDARIMARSKLFGSLDDVLA